MTVSLFPGALFTATSSGVKKYRLSAYLSGDETQVLLDVCGMMSTKPPLNKILILVTYAALLVSGMSKFRLPS